MVASIISAFASGLDIFRRMKAKQKPKWSRKKPERMTEEEWQLQNSLQHRPREIRAECDRSLARLGNRFAIGDSAAQASLNQTLLKFSVGLIQLVSETLSNDTRAQALSRRSLLKLSETAAADTVRALEQLHSRLSASPQLTLTAPPSSKKKAPRSGNDISNAAVGTKKARPAFKPRSKSFSTTERKRPGPDPLVRGAWIRSKSGTSVITATSSSGTSTPRAFDLKAASNSSLLHKTSVNQPSHHRTESSPSYSSRPKHDSSSDFPRESSIPYPSQSPPSYSQGQKQDQHLNRQPSFLLASPDIFTDSQTTRFRSSPRPPSPPPKIPLTTSLPSRYEDTPRLPGSNLRHRPPSVATFLTTSTKIGEIPEHTWLLTHNNNNLDPTRPALPWAEQHQHHQKPLPYVIPPRLEDEQLPKRKGRGFRFWKKTERDG
jgi:hypothetical protein